MCIVKHEKKQSSFYHSMSVYNRFEIWKFKGGLISISTQILDGVYFPVKKAQT